MNEQELSVGDILVGLITMGMLVLIGAAGGYEYGTWGTDERIKKHLVAAGYATYILDKNYDKVFVMLDSDCIPRR